MKNLQHYIESAQSKAIEDAGAFFAFGDKQFNKQKKEGITYIEIFGGLVCDKNTYKDLLNTLDNIHTKGIQEQLKEYSIEEIIKYELSNHEAYYSRDLQPTLDALNGYNVTIEQVLEVFNDNKQTV